MKKEELRIVFMGTPDFAVASLKAILDYGFNVVGIITAPDRKSGRGRKANISAVKKFALENELSILQPTNLKDEAFLNELSNLKPNLQVVVAFRMLPKSVWDLPELGTFNLHASLLPQYRGAAPINYAIINGERETGITTFFLDEQIDTGKVLLQEKVKIEENDNAGSLHDKLMILGSKLVVKTINGIIHNDIVPIEQKFTDQNKPVKKAHKINKEDCKINWNSDPETIRNFVRGLSPYPAAYSTLISKERSFTTKIFDIDIVDDFNLDCKPGSINVKDGKLYVKHLVDLLALTHFSLRVKKEWK